MNFFLDIKMFKRLSTWLNRKSNGWVALIALIVFILFMLFILPVQSSGGETPDTSLFYTTADLYRMAEQYGPAGREEYIQVRFTFDLIWPLVYGTFLVSTISWLARRVIPPESVWQLTNLVPLAGMLLDYLENISTAIVMARYPTATAVIDQLAPLISILKWSFVGLSFLFWIGLIMIFLWKWIKQRRM